MKQGRNVLIDFSTKTTPSMRLNIILTSVTRYIKMLFRIRNLFYRYVYVFQQGVSGSGIAKGGKWRYVPCWGVGLGGASAHFLHSFKKRVLIRKYA